MTFKHTPLYKLCLDEGCRMTPFSGWEMPIQFSGLVQEHEAVRSKAGLFDISHMGLFCIEGDNCKDTLQKLVPTDLHRIGPGEACYTLLLNEKGGVLDDLIIYDFGSNEENQEVLVLVINAACTSNDIEWIKKNMASNNIQIYDKKNEGVLLALQGPESSHILEKYFGKEIHLIPRFGHKELKFSQVNYKQMPPVLVARTGYTGEDGFEILLDSKTGPIFWKSLINEGVTPCGLGARDTLRLEAAMHLYGNDLDSTTTPFEAGLGWLVNLEMPTQFIGRSVLEKQASQGVKRRLVGLKLQGRAIARHGYQIFHEAEAIGEITSGTWSPTLKEAIALAYLPTELAKIGQTVFVEVRGKKQAAKVVKRPFYKRAKN